MDFLTGEVLIFDKPLTWTSFDLVNKVRWTLCRHLGVKKLKVGHAGTLDPLATGIVTICTGKRTKTIDQLQAQEKEYVAELTFGATTPSFDLESEVDATFPYEHITLDLLEELLPQFTGGIMQVPPAFSAVKVNGKRAYSYARQGQEVEIKAKELVIESITVEDISLPKCTLKIVCSKGTYIRALARDIGKAIGSGAHLSALRRTRVGDYTLDGAYSIEDFVKEYLPEEYVK